MTAIGSIRSRLANRKQMPAISQQFEAHAFVPADPAPVIVSPENVDLDGAGTLDFTPQPQG
jgi:hypothetical protein